MAGAFAERRSNNKTTERNIMAKISELAEAAEALEKTVDKVFKEVGKLREDFDKLSEQLEAVEIPARAQRSLDRIKEKLAAIDALNVDVDAEEPAE